MVPWITVADQLPGPGVQILLGVTDALGKGRRRRAVEDANAAAGALGHLDAVEAGAFVLTAGTDCPDLTGGRGRARRGPRSAAPR